MGFEDAKKTVAQNTPDQVLLQLARVETTTSKIGECVTKLELSVDRFEKYFSSRMLDVTEKLNSLSNQQGDLGKDMASLTVISKNNADQIMEIKADIRGYSDRLNTLEKRVEDVAAVQRMCPARSLWQNWEEDSKVVRVMQGKLQDHLNRRTTPGEGLSVRFTAKKISVAGIVKVVVGAIAAAAISAATWFTAELATKEPRKAEKTEQTNDE